MGAKSGLQKFTYCQDDTFNVLGWQGENLRQIAAPLSATQRIHYSISQYNQLVLAQSGRQVRFTGYILISHAYEMANFFTVNRFTEHDEIHELGVLRGTICDAVDWSQDMRRYVDAWWSLHHNMVQYYHTNHFQIIWREWQATMLPRRYDMLYDGERYRPLIDMIRPPVLRALEP